MINQRAKQEDRLERIERKVAEMFSMVKTMLLENRYSIEGAVTSTIEESTDLIYEDVTELKEKVKTIELTIEDTESIVESIDDDVKSLKRDVESISDTLADMWDFEVQHAETLNTLAVRMDDLEGQMLVLLERTDT